jgi:hypothetical protein
VAPSSCGIEKPSASRPRRRSYGRGTARQPISEAKVVEDAQFPKLEHDLEAFAAKKRISLECRLGHFVSD